MIEDSRVNIIVSDNETIIKLIYHVSIYSLL